MGTPSWGNMPYQARFFGRGVLYCKKHGASPLAAETDALAEAEDGEQQRRGESDGGVGGQQSDGDGRDAHGGERDDEGGFAADAVSEVAEEGGTDGTGEERDAEGGKGGEAGGGGIGCRKEERREDEDGGGSEDVEVEELDGGADEAGEEDLGWGVDAGCCGGCCGHRVSVGVAGPVADLGVARMGLMNSIGFPIPTFGRIGVRVISVGGMWGSVRRWSLWRLAECMRRC
jgi:hypothetical protein